MKKIIANNSSIAILKMKNKKIYRNAKKINLSKLDKNIIFEILIFILFLFLEINQSANIDIKVNKIGDIQILSNEYRYLPSQVKVNGNQRTLINKTIQVDSENDVITLIYSSRLNNFSYMFNNLDSIIYVHMNYMFGTNNTFSYMFNNCTNLKNFTYLIEYSQSHSIKDMRCMFYNCISLESFNFDNLYMNYIQYIDYYYSYYYERYIDYTVTYYHDINMSYMFYNCQNIKLIIGNNNFKNYISDMRKMFYNCLSLESIDLTKFIIKSYNYINVSHIFYNCQKLKTFQFSSSYFYISDIRYIFYNCSSIEEIDFGNFISTSNNYINMSSLLYNCNSLISVKNLFEKFHANDNGETFYNCTSLTSIDLRSFSASSYINLSYMFFNCTNLRKIVYPNTFTISAMDKMFYNCSSLESIDLSKFSGNNYYLNLSKLFYNCKNLTTVSGINRYYYISDTTDMFYNCISLNEINFYPYITTPGINMTKMFYNCTNIKTIIFGISSPNYYKPNDLSFSFYNCESLKSLTFKRFNTSILKKIKYMLYNCKALIEFNIQNSYFINSLIKNMRGVFENCESLITLDLSTFYTPNVEIMWDMFKNCHSLKNLNIQNFDTSKVTDMGSMFEGCWNLISLNLYNFNTSNVQYMNKMFKDCYQLERLNFNTISTEALSTMHKMFYNCKKLYYLNMFSLIESGQSINEIFSGSSDNFTFCIKDEKNIPNIFEIIINEKNNVIRDCTNNCYNDEIKRYSSLDNKYCCSKFMYNGICYDKCPSRTLVNNNIDINCQNFSCTYFYNYEQDNCSNSDIIPEGYYINDTFLKTIDKCNQNCKTCKRKANYCLSCNDIAPFFYLGHCYNYCKYGTFIDNDGISKCKCFEEKCYECSEESLMLNLCVSCNKDLGYFPKYNDTIINENFTNCYKNPEGYYFNSTMYMPCYYSCKNCGGYGDKYNHFCTSCNSENSYQIISKNNYINCYPDCLYNFYFDDNDNYQCLNTSGCPSYARLLIHNTKQCIKSCNKTKYKFEFRNKCYENCPSDSKNFTNSSGYYCNLTCPFERPFEMVEQQICVSSCTIMERYYKLCITNYNGEKINEIQDIVMLDIKNDVIDTFDYKFISQNRSVIYYEKNIKYEITYTNNTQTDSKNGNFNLGKCENLLREYYQIEQEEPLYILKIDAYIEGKLGPKVEYEIYFPFDRINLHQLDLSICEGIEISIGFQFNITEDNLDVFDKNSPYYNDICYPTTYRNGVDITLVDRQKEFIDNNKSVCDEGCKFIGYDKETGNVECSCEIKANVPFISQIKIDKDKLYNFINIKKIANFNVMICYNLFFSLNIIIMNIGFYFFIPTVVVYFVYIVIFYKKEFHLIKSQIREIAEAKKNKYKIKLFTEKIEGSKKRRKKKSKKSRNSLRRKKKDKSTLAIMKEEEISSKHLTSQNNDLETGAKMLKKLNKIDKKNTAKILKFNDDELNDLNYNKAIKFDKRNFFKYYFSLLKTKHLIFKIFNERDYNSKSIKIILLFFNFLSCYAINALFFSDETMHQIYEDEGNFNIIYQLPQIIYSTIISFILDLSIDFLALSQDNIISIKQDKKLKGIKKKAKKTIKLIRNKLILFFIINFILIIVFGYYLGCFCAVYRNTQFHLIKDTLISYGIGIITPFGTNLFPAIFRIYSLSSKNKGTKGKKILYKFSQILQKF